MRLHLTDSNRSAAFTLLEVLLATALFAVSSTALVQVVLNTLTAINAQPQWSSQSVDQAFALGVITAIETRESFEQGGQITSPSGHPISWSATSTSTAIADLHAVEISLEWHAYKQSPAQTSQLLVYWYRPWLSDPSERAARLLDQKVALETE